jgi:hypothetical protein
MAHRRGKGADLLDTAQSAGKVSDNIQGAMRKVGGVNAQLGQLPKAIAGDVGDIAGGVGRGIGGLFRGKSKSKAPSKRRRGR